LGFLYRKKASKIVNYFLKIFCFLGGYDGLNLLQTVEKYGKNFNFKSIKSNSNLYFLDINLGRWSQMAPMLIPRSGRFISFSFLNNSI
jgi:hypothetical protein